jgi:hypothetical protein
VLREQLEADITGKKDLHDKIVENYETSIRDRMKQRREDEMRIIDEMKKQRQEEPENGFIQILTKDQLEDLRKKQTQEINDWMLKQSDLRNARANQYQRDKEEIAQELNNKFANEINPKATRNPRLMSRIDRKEYPKPEHKPEMKIVRDEDEFFADSETKFGK